MAVAIRPDDTLTLFIPHGAVNGCVVRYTRTGLVAQVDQPVPRDVRIGFVLYFRRQMIRGDVECIGQDDRIARLQFCGLTARDWLLLEPMIDPND